MKAMILIPTYNEATSVVELLHSLDALRNSSEFNFDVTVIDDNSPDGTAEIVRNLGYSWVDLLQRPKKDGLGNAYRAGFARVLSDPSYDQIVTMDADGSHRVADLPAMFAAISPGKSIVLGTRWIPGGSVVNWPKSRQLLSRSGTRYSSFALGINSPISQAAFASIVDNYWNLSISHRWMPPVTVFKLRWPWHHIWPVLALYKFPLPLWNVSTASLR